MAVSTTTLEYLFYYKSILKAKSLSLELKDMLHFSYHFQE